MDFDIPVTKVTTGLKQLVAQVLLPEVRSEEEVAVEAGATGGQDSDM